MQPARRHENAPITERKSRLHIGYVTPEIRGTPGKVAVATPSVSRRNNRFNADLLYWVHTKVEPRALESLGARLQPWRF